MTHSYTFHTLYCELLVVITVINFVSGEVIVINSFEFLKVSLLKQFRNFVCLNKSVRNAFMHFVLSSFVTILTTIIIYIYI